MFFALCRFELFIPQGRSLKGKRSWWPASRSDCGRGFTRRSSRSGARTPPAWNAGIALAAPRRPRWRRRWLRCGVSSSRRALQHHELETRVEPFEGAPRAPRDALLEDTVGGTPADRAEHWEEHEEGDEYFGSTWDRERRTRAVARPLRRERVTELIHHELGDIIQREVRDPRLGWVTVTRVEMSSDLCYAKVFISVLGGDERARENSLRILEGAAPSSGLSSAAASGCARRPSCSSSSTTRWSTASGSWIYSGRSRPKAGREVPTPRRRGPTVGRPLPRDPGQERAATAGRDRVAGECRAVNRQLGRSNTGACGGRFQGSADRTAREKTTRPRWASS